MRLAGLPACRDLRRGRSLRHQRPPPGVPAHDRGGHDQARAVRCRGGSQLLTLLPRPFRAGILRQETRQERRQARLHYTGDGRRPHARHDAADHGAVRRVSVQGERQARSARLEGERAAGLLERLTAAYRLSRRGCRAARIEDEEEAGDRPAPRRHCAPNLPPCAGRRRHVRPHGREGHCHLPEQEPHVHPQRRALGHWPASPYSDPAHLYGRAPVQQAIQGQRGKAQGGGRHCSGAAFDRRGDLRDFADALAGPQPEGAPAAGGQRPDLADRHLLLRQLRRRDDAAHRQKRPLPLLCLLDPGAAGRHRLQGPRDPHGKAGRYRRQPYRDAPARS